MNLYVNFVKSYPMLSGMLQFAILGPIGEYIAIKIKKQHWEYTFLQTLLKALSWSVLAIFIKYAFVGFGGFVKELVSDNLLPVSANYGVFNAFLRSAFTNIMFGPILVVLHRVFDNWVEGKSNYKGINKALFSLVWFWIPAHTLTFSLPVYFQMGLAAVWSLALGLILGIFNKK